MDQFLFNQELWMSSALCSRHDEKELWFSDRPEDIERAKSVCGVCFVKTECLEYAVTEKIREGVWGGYDEGERVRLSRSEWFLNQLGGTSID